MLCISSLTTWAQQNNQLQELLTKRQFATIIQYVDSLTPADSTDYTTMSTIGQAYEGLLEYGNAYRYYQHCLQMDTTNVEANNAVARIAMNLGKAAVAQNCFRNVLKVDSTDFYANYQLGRLYSQLGEYEQAIAQFDILRNQDSTRINPVIYRNIGDCYMRLESTEAAALCYFQAYNVNRENVNLATTLINCLYQLGGTNIADALAICDTALYYNPDNRALLRSKGMGLFMNKEFAQADTIYAQLMAAGDSSLMTLKYGGASRYSAGRMMDAIEPLEKAYLKDSTDIEVNLLLGAAFGKTYDRKRAFQLFNQAEQLMQPNEVWVNILQTSRAETLWRDNRPREAERIMYALWLEDKEDLGKLLRINRQYGNWGASYKDDEESKARALFIKTTYAKICLQTGESKEIIAQFRPLLQYFYEEAFFTQQESLPMTAPDGKKSRLLVSELKSLLDQLPEETKQ